MADITAANGQVTDAVTQSNVEILGLSPAQAMSTLYQTMAQAIGLSIQNATLSQQQAYPFNTSATVQGVNLLFNTGPAISAVGARDLLSGNALAQELSQAQALASTGAQMLETIQGPPAPNPPPKRQQMPGAGGPWAG